MKLSQLHKKWFTLVEVLVAITIFSMMFISIIWIYIITSDINMKSDINRVMYENIKNLSSKIWEDIKKDWILWVSTNGIDDCNKDTWSNYYKLWTKLCTNSWKIYYLAKKDIVSWKYLRVDNSACVWLQDNCVIAMWPESPLTNSYVSIKEFNMYLSKDSVSKVTLNLVIQPSLKKWVKPDLIKESKLIFQTTFSERPF